MCKHNKSAGYSLLELMIVVALIGVLSAIGYPSFVSYQAKGRRVEEAKGPLYEIQSELEQFSVTDPAGSYTTVFTDLNNYPTDSNPTDPPRAHYAYSIAAGATGDIATSYVITATPQNGQQTVDVLCGNLTLDNFGVQGVSGADPASKCWR